MVTKKKEVEIHYLKNIFKKQINVDGITRKEDEIFMHEGKLTNELKNLISYKYLEKVSKPEIVKVETEGE